MISRFPRCVAGRWAWVTSAQVPRPRPCQAAVLASLLECLRSYADGGVSPTSSPPRSPSPPPPPSPIHAVAMVMAMSMRIAVAMGIIVAAAMAVISIEVALAKAVVATTATTTGARSGIDMN